jgi:hypothetical protein
VSIHHRQHQYQNCHGCMLMSAVPCSSVEVILVWPLWGRATSFWRRTLYVGTQQVNCFVKKPSRLLVVANHVRQHILEQFWAPPHPTPKCRYSFQILGSLDVCICRFFDWNLEDFRDIERVEPDLWGEGYLVKWSFF